jgi:hypothetical protein
MPTRTFAICVRRGCDDLTVVVRTCNKPRVARQWAAMTYPDHDVAVLEVTGQCSAIDVEAVRAHLDRPPGWVDPEERRRVEAAAAAARAAADEVERRREALAASRMARAAKLAEMQRCERELRALDLDVAAYAAAVAGGPTPGTLTMQYALI